MWLMATWCFIVCWRRPSLWASSARRSRRREHCRLVVVGLGVDVVVLSAHHRDRPPLVLVVFLRGIRRCVHSPGRKSGYTLPHREAKVCGVGPPRLGPRSSLGTPARCVRSMCVSMYLSCHVRPEGPWQQRYSFYAWPWSRPDRQVCGACVCNQFYLSSCMRAEGPWQQQWVF